MDVAVEQAGYGTAGRGEFRRGWQIVLASFLGIALGLSPMPFYTMGVFAPHLAAAFGWSIGQIMGGLTATTVMMLWAGPVAGILAERFGVRRVALTSLALFGLAFMALALSTGSLIQYYLTWSLIAALGAGTLPITWTKSVNRWFDLHKGLALGISMMGTGLFGILCKPFLAAVIGAYGWRAGYVGLGLLPLLIAWPAAWLLFREAGPDAAAARRTTTPGGLTLPQALRTWRFWLIGIALVPISFTLAAPVPNLELILKEGGVDAGVVLRLTPLVGLSALFGRLVGGWLLDRFWAPSVAFVILGLPALSFWMLSGGPFDHTHAALAILLLGFALGVEYDVIAYLVARYFGLRSYSAIYGLMYVFFAVGSGVGPLVFGWMHDRQGNYASALTLSSFLLVAAAATLLALGRYRNYPDEEAAA